MWSMWLKWIVRIYCRLYDVICCTMDQKNSAISLLKWFLSHIPERSFQEFWVMSFRSPHCWPMGWGTSRSPPWRPRSRPRRGAHTSGAQRRPWSRRCRPRCAPGPQHQKQDQQQAVTYRSLDWPLESNSIPARDHDIWSKAWTDIFYTWGDLVID